MTDTGRLSGKVAIITGASQGFGKGIAELFHSEGAKVVVADILDEAGLQVANSLDGAIFQHADVSSRADTAAMIKSAKDAFGRLDILVNNAGYSHSNKPIADVTDEDYDRIFDVNVRAIFYAVQESLALFREQGFGNIINTSSTAGLRPRPGLSVYNSSKGAVNTLTKSLAVELAPDGIRVNAICPVIGETGLLETFMGVKDTPENRARFEQTIPLGRFSRPQDIAQAMLFLASSDSEFITGVTLEVDGGRCV